MREGNGSALPFPPISGIPEMGIHELSKSDISDFEWER
jgi:hypothetical protein